MFDEPLSNLDAALRTEMRVELSELHKKLGTTMVYVTHDQVEAMTLADRIVVINGGIVEQIGSPMELYQKPLTPFVAGFIGSPKMNFFKGSIAEKFGAEICGIRPEHVTIDSTNNESDRDKDVFAVSAKVTHVEKLGADTLIYVNSEEFGNLLVRHPAVIEIFAGNQLDMLFSINDIHFFRDNKRFQPA